jgi:[acyl-carrier-protein] S-malonyltransferase
MGRPWADHPSWEVVEDASRAAGRDIGWLLNEACAEKLTQTHNAQLATFTFSLMVLDAVERIGVEPTRLAGHSVGEYSALAASGSLGFDASVQLVAERGEAMQSAAEARPGAMTVLEGCDADTADVACRLAEGDVWLANINTSDESVIAGDPEAIEVAVAWALRLGAKRTYPVRVSGAFHTPLMAPARERLRKMLDTTVFHDPETPLVANVDSRFHTGGDEWRLMLSAQLCSPVRWHQSVLRLAGALDSDLEEEKIFVELGSGDSLCATVRQTLPSAVTLAVSVPNDLDRLVDTMAGDSALHTYASVHHGELLYVSERVLISPCAGIFEPPQKPFVVDERIEVGGLVGTVSASEIRSSFAGVFRGYIAQPGERVQAGQPIAWLHNS